MTTPLPTPEEAPQRSWLARNRVAVAVTGVLGLGVAAFLAIGVFGVHTLFFDNEVSEEGPVFASGAVAESDAAAADDGADTGAAAGSGDDDRVITDPKLAGGGPVVSDGDESDDTDAGAAVEADAAAPEVVTSRTGSFVPRGRYDGEGTAVVLTDGIQTFLRFEGDFATDNGPDLNVYLVNSSADAPNDELDDDFIDLGDLTGNIGSQNYELPADIDLEVYDTVVVWCVRFGVAFTAADLAPAA